MNIHALIERHGLAPDPAGGWSRTDTGTGTDNGVDADGERTLHLLGIGDCLDWFWVAGSDERWTHLDGGPLALTLSPNGHDASAHRLGRRPETGELLTLMAPDGHWRTAEPLGEWTLIEMHRPHGGLREAAPAGWYPVPRAGSSR